MCFFILSILQLTLLERNYVPSSSFLGVVIRVLLRAGVDGRVRPSTPARRRIHYKKGQEPDPTDHRSEEP